MNTPPMYALSAAVRSVNRMECRTERPFFQPARRTEARTSTASIMFKQHGYLHLFVTDTSLLSELKI